jgi:hypothetical protein
MMVHLDKQVAIAVQIFVTDLLLNYDFKFFWPMGLTRHRQRLLANSVETKERY